MAWAAVAVVFGGNASAESVDDLRHMSLSELGSIDVTSVQKTPQALADAPAAIYVITHEDAVRSGARTLAEILRLAPNLQVYQTSASHYVVTARGFNGNTGAQNFSNQLLVLIDGRTVYTPLFSGVYWDMQDVPPEDIERIEVIRGPGATLWGANAVNGVINIVTRKSSATQGGFLDVHAGNLEHGFTAQYGGRLTDALTYRLYIKDEIYDQTETPAGGPAHDAFSKPQGGFRLDWTPNATDTVTLQGDAYVGAAENRGAAPEDIAGRNLTARWSHDWNDGSALQVQAYYDRTGRATENGGGDFHVDTYDLDVQQSFSPSRRHHLVVGGGLRLSDYRVNGTPSLFFTPASRRLILGDVFGQDSITLGAGFTLILGLKLEDDPYSNLTPLPSARLSWTPSAGTLVWAAVSRAIRAPTPFDRDVQERVGTAVSLSGGDFQPSTLEAYEAGVRVEPSSNLSLSVSAFYNTYDQLRTIEKVPSSIYGLSLVWGNGLRGDTYGLEAWGDYRVTPWWRLSAGFNALRERFEFKPGATRLIGVSQIGDDPHYQASLKSSMNLGRDVMLDADLRFVDALPNPRLPAYEELNARIAWNLTPRVQLSVSGFNLLHERHLELPPSEASAIPRSVLAGLLWRF